ncbi:uncharacterized protein IUM83_03207 [Phytophthora cinnamomi]|uniref:uncharacterized protein n=1 Tax=Phytophthora cinnamomi TaxID=4785 RepID=UPI003559C76B|nr:hypothetical protein IUM83_03207 [Phytophthora cinnamomi]
MLSLAPIINGSDDLHNAVTHKAAFHDVLSYFGKTLSQVAFLIGDNCSVNKKLARLMAVLLVSCSSRRFNLAVKGLTEQYKGQLSKVEQLIIKLLALNRAARFRFHTLLRPALRQDTRWSSMFSMVARYFELSEFTDREDDALAELLPTPVEHKKLKAFLDDLKNIESVSKKIQSADISMWEVRSLFDALIELFPQFNSHIGPSADILTDPHFESAVVKIQRRDGTRLSRLEKAAVAHLRADDGSEQPRVDADAQLGFADRVLKGGRVDGREEQYLLMDLVFPTSNQQNAFLG